MLDALDAKSPLNAGYTARLAQAEDRLGEALNRTRRHTLAETAKRRSLQLREEPRPPIPTTRAIGTGSWKH